MTLKVTIHMDNAAFDGDKAGPEAVRLLRKVCEQLEETPLDGFGVLLRDANGNTVGEAKVMP